MGEWLHSFGGGGCSGAAASNGTSVAPVGFVRAIIVGSGGFAKG